MALTNGANQRSGRGGPQALHNVLFLVATNVMGDVAETLLYKALSVIERNTAKRLTS
jgi:hypothetical protein